MDEMAAVLAEADVIVGPASPLTAWRTDESAVTLGGRARRACWRPLAPDYPFNLAGLPAIALPCGFDRRGLPISLRSPPGLRRGRDPARRPPVRAGARVVLRVRPGG